MIPRFARIRPPGTAGFGRDGFGSAPFGAPRIVVDLLARFGFGRAPFGTSPFGTPQPPTGG